MSFRNVFFFLPNWNNILHSSYCYYTCELNVCVLDLVKQMVPVPNSTLSHDFYIRLRIGMWIFFILLRNTIFIIIIQL